MPFIVTQFWAVVLHRGDTRPICKHLGLKFKPFHVFDNSNKIIWLTTEMMQPYLNWFIRAGAALCRVKSFKIHKLLSLSRLISFPYKIYEQCRVA